MKEIILQSSLIGDQYYKRITTGPYIRVTDSQEGHIEDGLKFWLRNTDAAEIEKVSTETSNQGTVIHNYISGILKNETIDVQEEWCKPVMEGFKKFADENKIIPIAIETPLLSENLGLGGKPDFIGTMNGALMIIDWKTGAVYPSYGVQLALYMIMHWENSDELIQTLRVISVHREAKPIKVTDVENPWAYLRAGLCTFERWKFDNSRQLDWACAPKEITDQRAKLKTEKRTKFEEENWKPEYQWPWLKRDSLIWLDKVYQEYLNTNQIKGA